MIAHVVRALVAAGATPDMILAAVEAAEAERCSVEEARREKERGRTRYRREECGEVEWRTLRLAVFERDGGKCVYCGATGELAADHIIPLQRGGRSVMENLNTACRRCNSSKGTRLVEEWLSCR